VTPAAPTAQGKPARAAAATAARGRPFIALCGGALGFCLLLVIGQVVLIGWQGIAYFWQSDLERVVLDDGTQLLGEVTARETFNPPGTAPGAELPTRIQLHVANRDVGANDFVWVEERRIVARERPADAVLLERIEWGDFHGFVKRVRRGEQVVAEGAGAWDALLVRIDSGAAVRAKLRALERGELDDVNQELEKTRLAQRRVELDAPPAEERERRLAAIAAERTRLDAIFRSIAARTAELKAEFDAEVVDLVTASGQEKTIPTGAVLSAIRPDAMGVLSKSGLYLRRVREFLFDDPRESNTEGGIFPAIFGTVLMVFLMSIAVVPLGVLAALYLREYARQGLMVRIVRIAVNNLAGVPSIVFGVFGLGFFVYGIGGTIDRLFFAEALPRATFGTGGILWAALTLALLTVPVVIVATEEGLAAVPRAVREGSLALGATKFETIWRVVLPAAAPGMLTGLILAIARAAGEVAPLMIVGMVKLAPALPIDRHFPFLHLENKFMHLGFHIFDVGFQSPNVEATKPLVFATAFLLLVLVVAMNLTAITVRNRLRRRYASSAV
jgi:phosphate transport system permease protein